MMTLTELLGDHRCMMFSLTLYDVYSYNDCKRCKSIRGKMFSVPKGLPAPLNVKLYTSITTALKDPRSAKKLGDIGFAVVASTPKEFEAFQAAEVHRWRSVIETGKVTVD